MVGGSEIGVSEADIKSRSLGSGADGADSAVLRREDLRHRLTMSGRQNREVTSGLVAGRHGS